MLSLAALNQQQATTCCQFNYCNKYIKSLFTYYTVYLVSAYLKGSDTQSE